MEALEALESLFCLSLSARDGVSAAVRETASLQESAAQKILSEWIASFQSAGSSGKASLFYVGTCHRVEIYGLGLDPDQVLSLWEATRGLRMPQMRVKTGLATLRHLIRVASSLESEVLGETQITGQVRDSAEAARKSGNLKGPLDWCVQQSLRVTKRIRASTSLGEGVVSVAHTAVDGLEDVFDDLSTKSALIIGAGSMAVQSLQRLQRRGVSQVTWVNRTEDRIRTHKLADSCHIETFDKLHDLVWRHAITVTATGSADPIVKLQDLKLAGRAQKREHFTVSPPRVILDLGLPRNVDENIHGYSGFYVRNVDEFSNRIQASNQQRQMNVSKAEEILEEELISILKLSESRDRAALLNELKEVFEALKSSEMVQMKLEKNEDLEYVARAINSKLLHRLIGELEEIGEPVASQLLETLVRAWRLPDQWLRNEVPSKNPPQKTRRAKLVRVQ